MKFKHKGNGQTYMMVNEHVPLKINGEWVNGVIYVDAFGNSYGRTEVNFNERFDEVIEGECTKDHAMIYTCECGYTKAKGPTDSVERSAYAYLKTSQSDPLADKLGNAVDEHQGPGNPFKGLTFTDEERTRLAEVGCV